MYSVNKQHAVAYLVSFRGAARRILLKHILSPIHQLIRREILLCQTNKVVWINLEFFSKVPFARHAWQTRSQMCWRRPVKMKTHSKITFSFHIWRAEPILQRIKEDRTRIISPSFDNIKYDTFEIEEYPLSAQGFDWELWCRYLNPPKSWWHKGNKSAPIQ